MAVERDPLMSRVDHPPTMDIGWYLFSIMPSGVDEYIADQMVAEGIYGRPRYFGGQNDV